MCKISLLIFFVLSFVVEVMADQTAEELIQGGDRALAEKKWTDAAIYYEQFLKDFSSAAPPPLVNRIRFILAQCYMSKGDFSSALPAIQKALESLSGLIKLEHLTSAAEQENHLLLWKGIAQLETGEARKAAENFTLLLQLSDSSTNRKKEQRNEIILLRTNALIQAGKTQEAIQWLEEQNTSGISENYRNRLQLLKVEALITGGEDISALDVLLQISSPFEGIKFQLLAATLAQHFTKQGNPNAALRALTRTLSREEILKYQNARKISISTKKELLAPSCNEKSLHREIKEFEAIHNWDDSILLLRAAAFLELQRYREAALALEALQNPEFDEFVTALRCWLLVECPQRCLSLNEKWGRQFSQSSKFSLSQLLAGTAFLMLENYDAALHMFRSIQNGEFAENARVQEIKTLLLAHKEEEALKIILEFIANINSPFLEEVLYLQGVAFSNKEEYDACREAMNNLLQRFPQGERAAAAYFLRASAAYRKMDFPTAITELRSVLQKFPESQNAAEAWLLLGDALLDQQKINEGLIAYRNIPCSSLSLHEIAIFRLAKAFKKLGRWDELKQEMEKFQQDHPASPRLAEAIREIGSVYRDQNKLELVYPLYWKTIEEQGIHPNAHAVEILLQDLQKLYTTAGKLEDYQNQLIQLREQALKKEQCVLTLRIVWAQSRLLEDSLKKAQFITPFIQKADLFQQMSPRIICDFADSLFAVKKFAQAKVLYQSILKWHPTANERDHALAGLAREARESGDLKNSLSYWNQLLEQTPESRFVPEAEWEKAQELMKKENEQEQAILCLNKIVQHDLSSRIQKVEALYWLGEMYMKKCQPKLAIPYFQRIYIAYGADKKWVAKAYLRSAAAFELLGDIRSTVRSYQEMLNREDLKEFPEFQEAQKKSVYAENTNK